MHQEFSQGAATGPAPAGVHASAARVSAVPPGITLSALFAARAAARPDDEVLRFGGKGWTAEALNREAGAIAARLGALGIRRGGVVGIALPRTPAMVAAVLAVLQLGAAYLPLDPEYPEERIAFIARDAAVDLILTSSQIAGQFAASGARIVLLDQPAETDGLAGLPGPDGGPRADDLAYVLYTSGSTGRPKAVGVSHANVVNLIGWARDFLSEEDLSGVLFSTSLNFDLSVFEIFLPLCLGGRLILLQNLFALPRSADAGEVRLINSGPTLVDALLRTGGLPKGVRTVILAGERLPRAVAERLFAAQPGVRLINAYGPTETTVYSTAGEIDPADPGEPHIGRAVANTRLHVLDADGAAVAPGAVGELFIGGAGVSRGYIHRPDLDGERFVAEPGWPAGAEPAARMYRTGDLVRARGDGQLDFLGRADDQFQINGLRVEPGEIEAVLEGMPGVAQAVAAMRAEGAGAARLIGYLVAAPDQRIDLGDVRAEAVRRLPVHMRPVQYMVLERLPMTPNGKIDRKALPPPPALPGGRSDRQPETHIERMLAEIWEEVLGTAPSGISADFFDSGGDSLNFLSLVAAIETRLGVTLPMDSLYDSLFEDGITIAALATAAMMAGCGQAENLFLTVWQSFGDKPPLFLFPGIGGDALQMRALARAMGDERPLYIFHRRPGDECEDERLEDLASRCIALMIQRQPEGPWFLSGYSFGTRVVYEMARQLAASGRAVGRIVIIDAECPAWRMTARGALRALPRWLGKSTEFMVPRQGAGSWSRMPGRAVRAVRRKWTRGLAGGPPELGSVINPETITPELGRLVERHIRIAFDYQRRLRAEDGIVPARVPLAVVRASARTGSYLNAGPALGWERVAAGAPSVHLVPGNHATIIRPAGVGALAAAVRAALAEGTA